mmetsp:Transcript_60153/g.141596  ORF Transcript_60153/g.141596 Transcript_60153/m.141596 type:complete len:550 (+) Transcript_60153:53-1702(+)
MLRKLGLLLLCCALAHAITYLPSHLQHAEQSRGSWMHEIEHSEVTFVESFMKVLQNHAVQRSAEGVPGPEYAFVPQYLGSVMPGNSTIEWSSPCFKHASASISLNADKTTVSVTIQLDDRKTLLCDEAYLLATPFHYEILDMALISSKTITWTKTTAEEMQDLAVGGVRVFRFPKSVSDTISSAYETIKLFLGALHGGPGVPKDVAERNLKFLETYAHCEMPPRTASETMIDEDEMQSGDMLGIVRLDGLDPLIMWGTGSHLGHTAVIMRDESGVSVLESQVESNYWPQDRVQRTPFKQWVTWAKEADYNVVWIPLRAEIRARFNSTAALSEFAKVKGLLYGYHNLLFGWIDTPDSNFPSPLTSELLGVALSIADPLMRKASSLPSLWNGALRQRLKMEGGEEMSTAQLIAEGEKRGMTFGELMSVPEQDSWVYPGVRAKDGSWLYPPGPAMVCNVFVCRMWKAGGILPPGVNCGEFTPFDNYELAIFDTKTHLTPGCVDGDDISCQILGQYKISLPRANQIKPFPGMREHCPGTAPDYQDRIAVTSSC